MRKWLKSESFLTFEVEGAVAYITLNRPEKRNALNAALLDELHAALMEADDLQSVRCVVLQGAGKDFCAGYDLSTGYVDERSEETTENSYRSGTSYDDDAWLLQYRSQRRALSFDMFKPVIAKIHGNCLAGGTDIALLCDILIAADDARLGFPASRAVGSPANHMWLYHVGPQWAKRLLFTGDTISGADAAKIGLVLQSFPADRLKKEVASLANRVASVRADMLSAHKRIVNLGLELLGARTLQRLASENDARAHLSSAFSEFVGNVRSSGLKEAVKHRDAPFGNGEVKL